MKSRYSFIWFAIFSYFLPYGVAFTKPIFQELTFLKFANPPCAKDLIRLRVDADCEYALKSLEGLGSLFCSENSMLFIESPK